MEDSLKKDLQIQVGGVLRKIAEEVGAMEDRSRGFMNAKLAEIASLIQEDRARQDARIEALVKRAVKDEMADRRYSREVRRSVDNMNAAVEAAPTRSLDVSEAFYKEEEARMVANLQKSEENVAALRGINRRLRSRRKERILPPRPLKLRAPEVVVLDGEEAMED